MRSFIYCGFLLSLVGSLFLYPQPAQGRKEAEKWLNRQVPLYRIQDPARLNTFLKELHEHYPDFPQALEAVARLRVGTPYLLGCLGEEKLPDGEPLFRVDVADCTVFVLTTSALAHARSLDEARDWMKKLNYYPVASGDPVSYENRIHFTYDRLHKSAYFKDITTDLVPLESLRRVDLTLNVKATGEPLLNIPWKKKVTAYYLSSSSVNQHILKKLPSPCGVAFVREKNFANGVVVSHEGMLLDRRLLIEASSIKKKVVVSDFLHYLQVDTREHFDGVIFYEFY